jgi:hypothetical protein
MKSRLKTSKALLQGSGMKSPEACQSQNMKSRLKTSKALLQGSWLIEKNLNQPPISTVATKISNTPNKNYQQPT